MASASESRFPMIETFTSDPAFPPRGMDVEKSGEAAFRIPPDKTSADNPKAASTRLKRILEAAL
jgi:hypothetical protein